MQALGLSLTDVRILLTTQAHYDHMGAMAAIKKLTGAKMMVDEKDASVMADGGSSDYAYTFDAMKKLSFDIWLSSHAGQFGLHSKHKPGDGYNPAAFMDKKGYDKALSDLQNQFSKKVSDR